VHILSDAECEAAPQSMVFSWSTHGWQVD